VALSPGRRSGAGKPTVYFTMWESMRLPQPAIEKLNRCAVVIVPCGWRASMFSAAGVETPIRIVLLGIPMDYYEPGYPPSLGAYPESAGSDPPAGQVRERPFTFGTAARFESGGIRKGFGLVVKALQQAFGEAQDVRLRVKGQTPVLARIGTMNSGGAARPRAVGGDEPSPPRFTERANHAALTRRRGKRPPPGGSVSRRC